MGAWSSGTRAGEAKGAKCYTKGKVAATFLKFSTESVEIGGGGLIFLLKIGYLGVCE
jgi:hypothetical protein